MIAASSGFEFWEVFPMWSMREQGAGSRMLGDIVADAMTITISKEYN
jgi:hypothetical protein